MDFSAARVDFDVVMMGLVIFMVTHSVVFVPYYFIFKKAKVLAWTAFVPVYNLYMIGKVAKNTTLGVLFLTISLFEILINFIDESSFSDIVSLACFVFYCYVYVNLGRRFEVGLGFKIALCIPFVGWIMCLILGLGKEYVYHEFKPYAQDFQDQESELK